VVASAAAGALVAGALVAGTVVGAETATGDPQAVNSKPLASAIHTNEALLLVNISLPFWLDETGR
jgi:hypothetical protein